MRALIIEDDKKIADNIKKMVGSINIVADTANRGEDGLYQAETEDYDVIVLDWMLPDTNGINLCKTLRKKGNKTPVLFLTAKSQLEDKIEGLEIGADDYLTKPFAMEELLARIKALIRRKSDSLVSPIITIKNLTINTNTCEVHIKENSINLSPKEYAVLEYLAFNKNRVVGRMEILNHVWGDNIDLFSNTVDVHIRFLRKKIEAPFGLKLIKTIINKGYMLCDN